MAPAGLHPHARAKDAEQIRTSRPASPKSPGHRAGLGDEAGPRSSWDVSLRGPRAPGAASWRRRGEHPPPSCKKLEKTAIWACGSSLPILCCGPTEKPSLQLFWLSPAGLSYSSRDGTVLERGRAPPLASCGVLRAPGCSSPFKAGQQLMATCALPWHALRALCAAGTGTTGAPARAAVPCPVAVPHAGAAGGRHRMSGRPAGAAWGACHHAGSR